MFRDPFISNQATATYKLFLANQFLHYFPNLWILALSEHFCARLEKVHPRTVFKHSERSSQESFQIFAFQNIC